MATVDEVFEVVKGNSAKLSELVEWKAGMEKTCEAQRDKVTELREAVFANPSGIRYKVESLWNCKNGVTQWREFWRCILKALIIAGIIALASWVFFAFRHIGSGP